MRNEEKIKSVLLTTSINLSITKDPTLKFDIFTFQRLPEVERESIRVVRDPRLSRDWKESIWNKNFGLYYSFNDTLSLKCFEF